MTSINRPTKGVREIARLGKVFDWSGVMVGDEKTPADWNCEGFDFLSVEKQDRLFPEISKLLPKNHYSRKNIGYLYAIKNGADVIIETDDDNIPYADIFGSDICIKVRGQFLSGAVWVNIYRHFTNELIWPRGLPLDAIHEFGCVDPEVSEYICPVQQFLADEDPDVDAIYRLLYKKPLVFDKRDAPIVLGAGVWCPFNTQNTIVYRQAFPLLYLPSYVNFRMTDIWRSFVMQQSLWMQGWYVAFQNASVKQERNEHNLMRDFQDEVVGYIENRTISEHLAEAAVAWNGKPATTSQFMKYFWTVMIDQDFVPEQEKVVLNEWLAYF